MTFVDALRGVASIAVIFPHATGFITSIPGWTSGTRLMEGVKAVGVHGVDIFFVLSGFVIAASLHEVPMSAKEFGRFVVRRSLRLDPPYWAAILLAMLLAVVRHALGHGAAGAPPTLPQVAAHLFYLQGVLGYEQVNVVFWTLCLEAQLYLGYCLLLWATDGLRVSRAHVVVGLFLVSLAWPCQWIRVPDPGTWFLAHWYKFLAGAVLSHVVAGALPARLGLLVVALTAAAWAIGSNASALVASLTLLALFLAWRSERGLYTWLSGRVWQYLGRISYSTYLVHVPVIMAFAGVRTRLDPSSRILGIATLVASVTATLVVAGVFHRLVEAPGLRWARRYRASHQSKDRLVQPPPSVKPVS